ncbi:PREDICTED: GILT-like protein F37H8.5 [Papilio xuthus]|uniref:GILT-like protein F37H8.5 n=1 Tax=Papilio xuthus TaxID=66420 RepID=A0AAJ6ZIL7_PAPXU|nr:PREDICTED: GILT-like protein F37H8.5 [Papilio xuthus]
MDKIFLAIILCLLPFSLANISTVDGKVKITIGSTAGCSDTVRFINQQLVPAFELYSEYLNIEYFPWGRTRRDDNGTLICQFGVNDCWANRLHRCALHLLDNQEAQLEYMICEFSSPYPAFLQNSYQCAENVGLSINNIENCFATDNNDLESISENASLIPMQVINFVPFITLNDVIDLDVHNQARQDLVKLICTALSNDSSTGISINDC